LVISYFSDDFNNESAQWWVDSTIYNLPYASSPSWHTNYYHGPVYAIDDNPAIMFSSDHPRSDCVLISADSDSNGYSYFYDETGVFIENRYEWIVDLMYEEITNLTDIISTTGDISGNDYLDAYFIYMEAGASYNIILNRNLLPRDLAEGRHYENPGGLRIGTSEVTRLGMGKSEMQEIAEFMKKIIIDKRDPKKVKQEVIEFRKEFQEVKYCFQNPNKAYEYLKFY